MGEPRPTTPTGWWESYRDAAVRPNNMDEGEHQVSFYAGMIAFQQLVTDALKLPAAERDQRLLEAGQDLEAYVAKSEAEHLAETASSPPQKEVSEPHYWYGLDAQHNAIPISVAEAHKLMEDFASRLVARTVIGEVIVSTVFLVFDRRRRGGEGPPVLFETMAWFDGRQRRYCTWAEAVAGHNALVAEIIEDRKDAAVARR